MHSQEGGKQLSRPLSFFWTYLYVLLLVMHLYPTSKANNKANNIKYGQQSNYFNYYITSHKVQYNTLCCVSLFSRGAPSVALPLPLPAPGCPVVLARVIVRVLVFLFVVVPLVPLPVQAPSAVVLILFFVVVPPAPVTKPEPPIVAIAVRVVIS